MTVQVNFVSLETMNDYNYTTNSFAAVVSDTSGESAPFRIGKIVNLIFGFDGRFTNFLVHCYANLKECKPFYGKYCPLYLPSIGTVNPRSWVDDFPF